MLGRCYEWQIVRILSGQTGNRFPTERTVARWSRRNMADVDLASEAHGRSVTIRLSLQKSALASTGKVSTSPRERKSTGHRDLRLPRRFSNLLLSTASRSPLIFPRDHPPTVGRRPTLFHPAQHSSPISRLRICRRSRVRRDQHQPSRSPAVAIPRKLVGQIPAIDTSSDRHPDQAFPLAPVAVHPSASVSNSQSRSMPGAVIYPCPLPIRGYDPVLAAIAAAADVTPRP